MELNTLLKSSSIDIVNSPRGLNYNNRNERDRKIQILVEALRIAGTDRDIVKETLLIPDDSEKYGFTEGYHNLGQLLYFLADMLEE